MKQLLLDCVTKLWGIIRRRKTLKIQVTQEDIDKGEIKSSYLCPVALALSRAGLVPLVLGASNIEIRTKNDYQYSQLKTVTPMGEAKLKSFIFNFDGRRTVEPFSFYIYI